MIALLDVNVLIALFDPTHLHHAVAHRWFSENRRRGWATCPLTENGFVRIISQPRYLGRRIEVADAIDRLMEFLASGNHTFWPDSISLHDSSLFQTHLFGVSKRLTDVYLLGLAVRKGGRLATLDRHIQRMGVVGAEPEHLEVIRAVETSGALAPSGRSLPV